jgi:hypothetical protein
MATKRSNKGGSQASGKDSQKVRDSILKAFAAHWSEEGKPPRSVARFCKGLGITEAVFFKHFPSLHAVEKAFWRGWISGIISAVEEGDDLPASVVLDRQARLVVLDGDHLPVGADRNRATQVGVEKERVVFLGEGALACGVLARQGACVRDARFDEGREGLGKMKR